MGFCSDLEGDCVGWYNSKSSCSSHQKESKLEGTYSRQLLVYMFLCEQAQGTNKTESFGSASIRKETPWSCMAMKAHSRQLDFF